MCIRDSIEAFQFREHVAHTDTDDGMVVGKNNSNGPVHLRDCLQRPGP